MKNCINCQKRLVARMVLTIIDVKPSELARYLHVSESLVSKYLAGERKSHDLDLFFIEQIFAIKVTEYDRYDKPKVVAKLS